MVKTAEKYQKQIIMNMWDKVFCDSKSFMDLYFNEKYKDENCYLLEQAGQIVSSLVMIPYQGLQQGFICETGYFSGCTTLPDHQRKGLMSKLIKETLNAMYQRDFSLATLIPAEKSLFSLYKKYNFTTCYYKDEQVVFRKESSPVKNFLPYHSNMLTELFRCYEKWQMLKPCAILKDRQALEVVICDHINGGGAIFVLKKDTQIVGIVFAIMKEEFLVIKELVYFDKCSQYICLNETMTRLNQTSCLYITAGEKEEIPVGMARIINVYELLSAYARSNKNLRYVVSITDDLILENNASFFICDGTCTKRTHSQKEIKTITIEELTAIFFGNKAYMNLMLD